MKTAFLVAVIVALVAAAAWALAGSRPTAVPYTVEVRDVAGVRALTVVPEVVSRANQMPEVLVRGTELPEVAGLRSAGSKALN